MTTRLPFYLLLGLALVQFQACNALDEMQADDEPVGTLTSNDTNDDEDTNEATTISIRIENGSPTIDNPLDGEGVTVESDGDHVVIRSTIVDRELTYSLSGQSSNGSVKIYGDYRFRLQLNGLELTNPQGGALNIQCGKKVTVELAGNSINRLTDGETYSYTPNEDMKGTFFSEGQLNIEGEGQLEVTGKNKHAICTDDYFRMYSGTIIVKEAVSDAIHANDYIRMEGGSLTTRSVKEGLDCENGYIELAGGEMDITTTGEKGHGMKSLGYLSVQGTAASGGTTGIDRPSLRSSSSENPLSVNIRVSGNAAKCFNCGGNMSIGGGSLNLTVPANAFYDTSDADISSPAGIKCDGNLTIDGGEITINCSGQGGKGINVAGTLVINDGTINVTTTGQQFTYERDDTAAKAIKSTGDLTVNGGVIRVKTSGKEAEGMESKARLYVNGGDIEIEAYDDCINASTHLEFTGGTVYCYSATNDGIDSNGTMTISGGTIISVGADSPEEGFDCDQNRFAITGGVVIGIGGATSTPTTNACTQRSVVYGASAAFQILNIASTDGTNVLTLAMPRTYSRGGTILFSAPQLTANTNYVLSTGGSISGGTNYKGYYTGATYTAGTQVATFTTSSMVTTVGSAGNGGPGGGPGGGPRLFDPGDDSSYLP